MRTINDLRWLYHMSKAEEALNKGDEAKYNKHKIKMDTLRSHNTKRG